MDLGAGHGNKNCQAAASQKISPRVSFACTAIGFKFSPANRRPKRFAAQHSQGHVKKEKNQRVRQNTRAEEELRLIEQITLEFLGGHAAMRGVIESQGRLHHDKAGESEKNKHD